MCVSGESRRTNPRQLSTHDTTPNPKESSVTALLTSWSCAGRAPRGTCTGRPRRARQIPPPEENAGEKERRGSAKKSTAHSPLTHAAFRFSFQGRIACAPCMRRLAYGRKASGCRARAVVSLSLTHFIAFSDTPLLSASAPRFRFVFSCANEAHAWGVSVRVSVGGQGITAMGPAIALRPSPSPAPTPHPRWGHSPLTSRRQPSFVTHVRGHA